MARVSDENWPELRRGMVAKAAVVLGLAAWAGWNGAMIHVPEDHGVMLVGIAAALAATAVLLVRLPALMVAATPVAATFLAVFAAYSPLGHAEALPFFVVPVLLSAYLLSPWAAPATALAASALIAVDPAAPPDLVWIYHLLYAVTAALALGLTRDLRSSLGIAWGHAARIAALAREVSLRQEEVNRLNKALQVSNGLLKRSLGELALAQRDADEARQIKARFAANISHELRTPLNLIMGFSRMMYRSPEVYGDTHWTPELRGDIYEIYRASRHLMGMVDDILDLSRVEAQRLPLKLEESDLGTLVHEAAATARGLMRGSSVTLTIDVPAALPRAVLDRTRVRQVLLNLLNNAIRFTDRGEITVSARAHEGELEVSVADTGLGIPEPDLATIFDEFSQASGPITSGRSGAGLGLAVCKQFVQMHGGRISVRSRLGEGTTFTFSLPLPEAGRGRSRLSYYSPKDWAPPLDGRATRSVVVLAPDEAAAHLVARGIEGYHAIPVTDFASLPDVVEAEHPAGVVLVRDPLLGNGQVSADDLWAATGRPDLGVVECEIPIEQLAKRYLQVSAYLTKPVRVEHLLEEIQACGARTDRVLVVDDDPGFRTLMQRVLVAAFPQAAVELCPDGPAALRRLRQQRFDLVLLDLLMPEMTGVEFLMQARGDGRLHGTRVIITTGAPYIEELAQRFPPSLRFSKKAPPRGSEWPRCIKALLDTAPPDYVRPAESPAPAAGPLPRSAS